ncbi:PucR family transcriptional regulator [Streptomyces sp. NPDC048282]|uniref:PucR family transcriptional regulator n=1 Tax=Streptomyces sp. NPDC048282 TaxID=3365528 RepID=UPI00370FB23F
MPALTLREVLSLDPVRAARPELLAGEDALDRPVRWVHSSEVCEGANFLDGGELLLTNGFGLTDAGEEVRRRYVRELAARGAAGLAVEVGRSLPAMPAEVTDEARRLGLPLLALHRVVPFVRIAEAANRAIVARGLSGRSVVRPWGDDHTAALLADLADRAALNQPEVEARAALAGFHPAPGSRLIGVSVHGPRETGTVDRAVRLLGGAGVMRAAFPGDVLALIALPGAYRGRGGTGRSGGTDGGRGNAVRGGGGAAVDGGRSGVGRSGGGADGGRGDAVRGGGGGADGGRGNAVRGGGGAAVDGGRSGVGRSGGGGADGGRGDAVRGGGGAAVDGGRRGAGRGGRGAVTGGGLGAGDAVRDVQEAFRTAAGPGLTVAVGHAVEADGGWLHWSETLRAARTTLELALTVPPAEPAVPEGPLVTSARALALERELTRGGTAANRDRLAALVRHTLGPLLAWEAAHASDLVRTLEVHLRHGCSPTRTAALLHIGRQSLYQRLERIESLLGLEIDDPDLLGELLTAACAHRVVRGVSTTAAAGRLRTVA